jgi:peptide/nickel transport system substrate-binding protein
MRLDLTIEPDLAERWDYAPDLKSWTFHLRHGVKFHHGRELEADDVIKSLEHLLDPATGASARSYYDMI